MITDILNLNFPKFLITVSNFLSLIKYLREKRDLTKVWMCNSEKKDKCLLKKLEVCS